MNALYGSDFITKQRDSGYKSTVYSMAEIVDNSVDAKSKNIQIIFYEKEAVIGQRRRHQIDKIAIVDDGSGMTDEEINGCLTFSFGAGKSNSRIGAFGVGLPNASISVGTKVEVFSRPKGSEQWKYVFLDIENQTNREKAEFDDAVVQFPPAKFLKPFTSHPSTVVVWSNLDKLDATQAKTLIDRASKLLGRIYRYKLKNNDLSISMLAYREGNTEPHVAERNILAYDPLFQMTDENHATEIIWKAATASYPPHPQLGNDPEFNPQNHYRKFIEGCKKKQNKPIFQKLNDFWDQDHRIELNGHDYSFRIRAAFAYKSISKPGRRSGGDPRLSDIGGMLREKMIGSHHFKSANIFFIRAGREIDFGSYSMYSVTKEVSRFWTIEVHFSPELDELMGVANNKQSVGFRYTTNEDVGVVSHDDILSIGKQREILFKEISTVVTRAIRSMESQLGEYAREFKIAEQQKIDENQNGGTSSLPSAEPTVISVLPKGNTWSAEEKEEYINILKKKYMSIPVETLRQQVEKFSEGFTKTIVLYAPDESGQLFRLVTTYGKLVTFINTRHIYYENILHPLKSHSHLKIFAVAIEMLLSSLALEVDSLINDNREKYEAILGRLTTLFSSRLDEFIHDSHISIDETQFQEFMDQLINDSEVE